MGHCGVDENQVEKMYLSHPIQDPIQVRTRYRLIRSLLVKIELRI